MHLKTLLAGLSLRSATADMETEITHISYDSRTTAPGDVFVAMTGFATATPIAERLWRREPPRWCVSDRRRTAPCPMSWWRTLAGPWR